MANIQRNLACEDFNREYALLSETRKNNFSRLCNKLLNENFIYASKKEDRNDYYDVLSMKEMIQNYFSIIDFDLVHVDMYKIFYIQTNADRNRVRLKKFETVMLLILRLLYHKGSLNVNSSPDITVSFGSIVTEINQTGIYNSQISLTDYIDAFRLLKRYKLIDYSFNDLKEDNLILIYPTILYVAKVENINMLNDKINSYITGKGDKDNEVDED